ncbi:MAG: dihydrofolate reductase family protein [Brooklawnia sp.]|uniref:dihydrofolate reductase family protein n=1 Tax=Brooklawnia sp. TaxID=2699740 RepID=UPI003C770353
MGRIVFDTATSLNGWIADEQNSLAWLFAVGGGEQPEEDLMPEGCTVLVEGSTTYQWVLDEQDILTHPERWRDFHGDRPTFVFTTRQLPVPEDANIRFVRGSVADALPAIREAAGDGNIWVVGGGDLAGQFLDAGALDEIALSVAPVALTGGAPLLPRRVESDRLRLESARPVGQFARLVYRVLPSGSAGSQRPDRRHDDQDGAGGGQR